MHSVLFDEFVNVKPGQPYRLFPFGKIVKNGKVREITPEFAATIKLPHFKPAIKLGSHEEPTPAGGHIIGLEVRADGLYAVPEFNDKGNAALADGAYRYHSPEIIWEGGMENPIDGSVISAPLIVGDALLHMPHLGEDAALYSVEEITIEEQNTMTDNVTISASVLDKFMALFEKKQEVKEVEKVVEVVPEDYEATKAKLSEYEAERVKLQAEAEHKTRVEKFEGELKETKAAPDMAELLADLDPEKAEAIMKQFRALSGQINEEALTGEQGTPADGTVEDPKAAFNAAVLALMKSDNISNYNAAFEMAKVKHEQLFVDAFKKAK